MTAAEDEAWETANNMAMLQLGTLVMPSLTITMSRCETAAEMWAYLRNRYERTGLNAQLYLRLRFYGAKMLPGQTMQQFITTVEDLAQQLRDALDRDIDPLDHVAVLLNGRPDSYQGIIQAYETQPLGDLTVVKVQARLLDEFTRQLERKGGNRQPSALDQSLALNTSSNPKRGGRGRRTKGRGGACVTGQTSGGYPEAPSNTSQQECSYCRHAVLEASWAVIPRTCGCRIINLAGNKWSIIDTLLQDEFLHNRDS